MKEEEFTFLHRESENGSVVTGAVWNDCEQLWSCITCEGGRLMDALLISRFIFACLWLAATPTSTLAAAGLQVPAVWCNVRETPLGLKLDIFRTLTKWLLAGRTNCCQTQSVFLFFFGLTLFPSVLHNHTIESLKRISNVNVISFADLLSQLLIYIWYI